MMKMRRRTITLLEVVIAMGLLTLVVTALFSIYFQIHGMGTNISLQKDAGLTRRHLETELTEVFLQIPEVEKDKTFFYTESAPFSRCQTLVFSYDRGASIDPLFAGEVLGRLFVDREGNLFLTTWPSPEREATPPVPMIQQCLISGVEELKFSFFVPPKENISVETEQISEVEKSLAPSGDALTEWKKSYLALPPLVEISIVTDKKTFDFVFYLANNSYPLEIE